MPVSSSMAHDPDRLRSTLMVRLFAHAVARGSRHMMALLSAFCLFTVG